MTTERQQNIITEGTEIVSPLKFSLSMFLNLENLRNDRKIALCLFKAASTLNVWLSHIEMMLWISHKSLTAKHYVLLCLGSCWSRPLNFCLLPSVAQFLLLCCKCFGIHWGFSTCFNLDFVFFSIFCLKITFAIICTTKFRLLPTSKASLIIH